MDNAKQKLTLSFKKDLVRRIGLIKKKKGYTAEFKAPKKEGAYRLFVYAYDKKGHVAYVNIPFYVKPSSKADRVRLKKRNLDFTYN